jgi:hypothetical protein
MLVIYASMLLIRNRLYELLGRRSALCDITYESYAELSVRQVLERQLKDERASRY